MSSSRAHTKGEWKKIPGGIGVISSLGKRKSMPIITVGDLSTLPLKNTSQIVTSLV